MKYYCPACNQILGFRQVKRKSEFRGMYTAVWKMCLLCGNQDGVISKKERIEQICCTPSLGIESTESLRA